MEETQTNSVSAWQKHERNELLAIEKPEWRTKRLEAENPFATADTLSRLAREAFASVTASPILSEGQARRNQACLLIDALAAHLNTPTLDVARLL